MNEIEVLKSMRDELLERADALDYCIRKIEAESHSGKQVTKRIKKERIGNTTFSISSVKEIPAIEPGGVFMTEEELY